MTCSERRNAYDVLVDEGRLGLIAGDMRQHLLSCVACRGYAASIAALDERLHAIEIPMPDGAFQASLIALAEEQTLTTAARPFARDLRPAVVGVLPCAVLWGASIFLPFPAQMLIQSLMSAAGIAAAAITFLKPRMVSVM